MSTDEKRPRDQVLRIAEQIVASLKDTCEEIEIAGSLRRNLVLVGDIEIVAVPRIETQASLIGDGEPVSNLLHERLDELMKDEKIHPAKYPAWGDKQRKFIVKTALGHEYQVDLYMCQADQFGAIYLIRTGSADFSRWVVTQRDMGGAMPADMYQKDGKLWRIGIGAHEHIQTFTEEDYFNAIQLPWVPPEHRQNDAWHTWLDGLAEWLEETDGEITWTNEKT